MTIKPGALEIGQAKIFRKRYLFTTEPEHVKAIMATRFGEKLARVTFCTRQITPGSATGSSSSTTRHGTRPGT